MRLKRQLMFLCLTPNLLFYEVSTCLTQPGGWGHDDAAMLRCCRGKLLSYSAWWMGTRRCCNAAEGSCCHTAGRIWRFFSTSESDLLPFYSRIRCSHCGSSCKTFRTNRRIQHKHLTTHYLTIYSINYIFIHIGVKSGRNYLRELELKILNKFDSAHQKKTILR